MARGTQGVMPYGRLQEIEADRWMPGCTTSSAAGAGAMGSAEGNPVRVARATGVRWCAAMACAGAVPPGRRSTGRWPCAGAACGAWCPVGGPPDPPRHEVVIVVGPIDPADRLRDANQPVYGPPPSIRNTLEVGLRRRGTGRPSRDPFALATRTQDVRRIAPSPPRSPRPRARPAPLSTPVDVTVDSGRTRERVTGTTTGMPALRLHPGGSRVQVR